jgi:cell division FtsZ-interacting protein ZapD
VGKVKWSWRPIERRRLRASQWVTNVTNVTNVTEMVLEPYREKEAEDQRGRVGGGWCVC